MTTVNLAEDLRVLVKDKRLDHLHAFLEKLNPEEKRSLAPEIKKLDKYYGEMVKHIGSSWGIRGTLEQRQMIGTAGFLCCTRKEFERLQYNWLDRNSVDRVLANDVPKWFGQYLNDTVRTGGWIPMGLEYDQMMKLKNRGVLDPSPTLIVRTLPDFPFREEQKGSRKIRWRYEEARLFRYPETLKEHIWLFFEEESFIHQTARYTSFENGIAEDSISWKQLLLTLAKEGKISRDKLLESSLQACNSRFSKTLTGWFADLFQELGPEKQELMALQRDLLACLDASHSKPVNLILKNLKTICQESKFRAKEFLDYTPSLLASETKTTVRSTLMILDKVAKSRPRSKTEIARQAVAVFLHDDSRLQMRAAKLITKCGRPKDEELLANLLASREQILTEVWELLQQQFPALDIELDPPDESGYQWEESPVLARENEIVFPRNKDDLLFLATQAFDNNDPLHFELFPAALIRFDADLTAADADRLAPVLQRALKLLEGGWRAGMGLLDHMLSLFFYQYACRLMQRFPEGTPNMKNMVDKYRNIEKERIAQWKFFQRTLIPFEKWASLEKSKIFRPYHHRLTGVLEQIRAGNDLPLLSTPTHRPGWIDPAVLIDRLEQWQQRNMQWDHYDFQLALSRLYLPDAWQHLEASVGRLAGEPRRLLTFILQPGAQPQGSLDTPGHWWTAAITKSPEESYRALQKFSYGAISRTHFTGAAQWEIRVEDFRNQRWDYDKRKMVSFTDQRKAIQCFSAPVSKQANLFARLFKGKPGLLPHRVENWTVYSSLGFKRRPYEISLQNDVARLFQLVPNQPGAFLQTIVEATLSRPELSGQTTTKVLLQSLEQLLDHRFRFHPMGHLLLAGSMIYTDKTVRLLAAEVWSRGVGSHRVDSAIVGQYIGRHFQAGFAPLKRFTDIIPEAMRNISGQHNLALKALLEGILPELPGQPLRGMKKLLEIYQELELRSGERASATAMEALRRWIEAKSLKSIVLKLTKKG